MTTKIIDRFLYKGHRFVIVRNGEWYMAINETDIDSNGKLKKTVYGGYRSIPELIKCKQLEIDVDDLVDLGMDRMTAIIKLTMGN